MCCLVILLRNVLKAGDVENHHVAGLPPQVNGHDGVQGGFGIVEEIHRLHGEGLHHMADHADIGGEQKGPDGGETHHGGHVGIKDQGSGHADPLDIFAHQGGQQKADHQPQRDHDQGEFQGVFDHDCKHRVLKYVDIILKPDKFRGHLGVVAGFHKTLDQGADYGVDGKSHQEDERRQHEQPALYRPFGSHGNFLFHQSFTSRYVSPGRAFKRTPGQAARPSGSSNSCYW